MDTTTYWLICLIIVCKIIKIQVYKRNPWSVYGNLPIIKHPKPIQHHLVKESTSQVRLS